MQNNCATMDESAVSTVDILTDGVWGSMRLRKDKAWRVIMVQ